MERDREREREKEREPLLSLKCSLQLTIATFRAPKLQASGPAAGFPQGRWDHLPQHSR
jgi:hypothetical protein